MKDELKDAKKKFVALKKSTKQLLRLMGLNLRNKTEATTSNTTGDATPPTT